ncbi:hypothetical protein PVAND_007560 [Polypedilum vanderplanki]|uniref:Tr-type G domain-containing protein n=1 Tax=Polypedilum vanderplanki TaxID=319348 RepID=A0A9J6C866_POLVA|nr:hypothetical protein PVAND_007560 [Polypedilum vanderplanki]
MSFNINVGLLGHVDSGKTSLSKVLSQIASTAAFDKNPQSQTRGITLDLGFSAMTISAPNELKDKSNELIFTFVDCPGHNSLIRTIISGNLIIDLMILVVDIQKGFEAQTGECLILAEISKKPMIVVLNKIDMIDESKRTATIEKMTKKVSKTLETTSKCKTAKIIPISATNNINIDKLVDIMVEEVCKMNLCRNTDVPFIFAYDHCFKIKGSGTILSGTVLQGSIKINDTIEIPSMKIDRKIKSMQMFKKPVERAQAGDRLGICITNVDSKLLERGLICQKGCVEFTHATVIKLNKIKYFKREIKSKSKLHCSIGHHTVMCSIILFSSETATEFNYDSEYIYEDQFEEEEEEDARGNHKTYFALIEFEQPIIIYDDMLLIASKLDTEQTNVCRLAFYGNIFLKNSSTDKNNHETFLQKLKIFKQKSREGIVQRFVNNYEVIVVNLFKKETDRSRFEGMKCQLSTGELGIVMSFGQSSKVKVIFTSPLQNSTIDSIKNSKTDIKASLSFKKFIFDKTHRMVQ